MHSPVVRALLLAPPILIGMILTFVVTSGLVFVRSDPELALRFDAHNSQALERVAMALAVKGTPGSARMAERLAVRSLLESPMSGEGASALGFARSILTPARDESSTFKYSAQITRRDVETQMWLVEHYVALGDIAKALETYDHIFRISDEYRAKLLPILLQASAQPQVAHAIAAVLASNPPWKAEFFGGLLGAFPGAENFNLLVNAMRFSRTDPDDRNRVSLAMAQLVEHGRPDFAFALYRRFTGNVSSSAIRNPRFDQAGGLTPFEWSLSENDSLSAQPGVNDANAPVLLLINRGGQSGDFARQLLVLRAGTYRLAFTTGNITGSVTERPKIELRCNSDTRTLTSTALPASPALGGIRSIIPFTVPSSCPAQWLSIVAGNQIDRQSNNPWVTDIAVDASSPSARR